MHPLRSLLLLPVLLLTACFQRDTTLTLQPDGSGTLEILTRIPDALRTCALQNSGLPPDTLFPREDTLRQNANRFGTGLTLLDTHTESAPGHTDHRVRFAFTDINTLKLPVETTLPLLPGPAEPPPPPAFRFEFAPGRLTILPPSLPPPRKSPPHVRVESARAQQQRREHFERLLTRLRSRGNPFRIPANASPEVLMEHLAAPLRITLRLRIPQGLISGNARFLTTDPETGTADILLFSLNGPELIQHPGLPARLIQEGPQTILPHELPALPGIRMETGEPVLLRFTAPTPGGN